MPIQYQPVYSDLNENRLLTRKVDEFMGIARTLSMKHTLAEEDFRYLEKWLAANKGVMDYPLVRPISDQITMGVREHGRLNIIHDELRNLSGDVNGDGIADAPALGVYDDPPPPIMFPGKRFCFTGTFDYGERSRCEGVVKDLGGHCGGIAQCTDYLVIGAKITDAWKHSTFGNKIAQAKAWRDEGHPIRIVSEQHWVQHLDGPGSGASTDEGAPTGPTPSSSAA